MMNKQSDNPFPGLRPFQKNESHLFFGRENHINEILRKLDAFRFVSIVGNSGSGKSSLVRAGILPKIENLDNGAWKLCIMRPGKNPTDELYHALFDDLFKTPESVEAGLEILNKSHLGLVQLVRSYLPQGNKLLILVDQFEEIFRFNSIYLEQNNFASASNFVNLLLSAVGQKEVPIYIIMTIRSDFLGDCEQFMGLPEAINDGQFLIPRMNREELQRSITGPVELVNGKISPHLVHHLLNDVVHSPDQLPVLQHVLMRSWEVWENENNPVKPIDIDTYNKTGGIAKALSNHAEEAYSELKTERNKKLAEIIFKAITLKGADNRGIRRPTSLGKISNIANAGLPELIEVIEVFRRADRGFLMPASNIELNESSVLDISHESLMRVWERLGTWVDEEADSAEIYLRICESAMLYDKNMAGLWRDPDLQIAVDWRENNHPNKFWADQYNNNFDLAFRFIDASIQDKEFMLAEKKRRGILTRVVIGIFLVVLSTLTLWAYVERNKSEKNESIAIKEKQKAIEQESFANQQKKLAEDNEKRAQSEKLNAEKEKSNAELQRKIAVESAMEAQLQKLKAERASLSANDARRAAELDKQIAQTQKQLSDSLRVIALESEKNAYRLRILTIAQTLAIKSVQAQKGTYDEAVKPLLALQAYNFSKAYRGKTFDPEIFTALFSSYRSLQPKGEVMHNYHSDAVRSLCLSPDGKSIASGGNDGKLIICNAADCQKLMGSFLPQPLPLENLNYNPSGDKISASADKNIFIYDPEKPTQKGRALNVVHDDKISALIWSGQNLISACLDGKIRLMDERNPKPLKIINLAAKPLCLSLCAPKKLLLIGCENGSIYSLNGETLDDLKLLRKAASNRVTSIDVSADGSKVAAGISDGNFSVFSLSDPETNVVNIPAHKSSITGLRFNPVSYFIASASLDGTIKYWDMSHPDEQPIVFNEHDSWVYGIAFSADGKELVSGGKDKTVRTYLVDQSGLISKIKSKLKRNFTLSEWNNFIGSDIPYEETIR